MAEKNMKVNQYSPFSKNIQAQLPLIYLTQHNNDEQDKDPEGNLKTEFGVKGRFLSWR